MAISIGPRIGIDGEAEYRKQLQNIIQSTKTLDKQMDALKSSFDDSTSEMEKNEKVLDKLEAKHDRLTEAVDKMQEMVDRAVDKYGEGSTEAEKWEAALANVETQLNECNSEIEDHQKAIEDLQSPMGELNTMIDDQQAALDDLKEQYANAWLEDDTARCEDLAQQIENLSGALADNQGAMRDAQAAADGFDQTIQKVDGVAESEGKVEEASGSMGSAFGGAIGGMVESIATGSLTDLIGEIVNVIMDIGEASIQIQENFDEAVAVIAQGTGAVGEDLADMEQRAKNAWAAVANKDGSIQDTAAIVANLNTRLGLTGDSAENAAVMFEQFAKATGEDGADAVNDVVDVMKQWGLVTGDTSADIQTMQGILDQLVVSSQSADISASQMSDTLARQAQAFQGLGMDMDDTMALMIAYRDAGGQVNDISTAARTAMQKLSGATDDVGGAFQSAIEIMQGTGTTAEKLQTQIGDTGLTIEDVFGVRRAQTMIGTFEAMSQSTTNWSDVLGQANGKMQETYANTITTQDGMSMLNNAIEAQTGLDGDLAIKAAQMTGTYGLLAASAEALARSTTQATGDMGAAQESAAKRTEDAAGKTMAAAQNVEKQTQGSYSTVSKDIDTSVNSSVSSVGTMQKQTIAAYQATANNVGAECSKMVGALNNVNANSSIYVSAHGALPVVWDQTGSRVVSYSLGWTHFAKGYDQAMILSAPTLFGMSGGKGLIGGDRPGNEIVVGESHLLDMIKQTVQTAFGYVPAASGVSNSTTTNNYSNNPTINVYGAPGQDVRELANIIEQKISRNVNRRSAVW